MSSCILLLRHPKSSKSLWKVFLINQKYWRVNFSLIFLTRKPFFIIIYISTAFPYSQRNKIDRFLNFWSYSLNIDNRAGTYFENYFDKFFLIISAVTIVAVAMPLWFQRIVKHVMQVPVGVVCRPNRISSFILGWKSGTSKTSYMHMLQFINY